MEARKKMSRIAQGLLKVGKNPMYGRHHLEKRNDKLAIATKKSFGKIQKLGIKD